MPILKLNTECCGAREHVVSVSVYGAARMCAKENRTAERQTYLPFIIIMVCACVCACFSGDQNGGR